MENIISDLQSKPSLFGGQEFRYQGMARVGMTLRPQESCAVFIHGPDSQIYELRFCVLDYEKQAFGALCLCGYDGLWRKMGYGGEWDLPPLYLSTVALHELGFAASSDDGSWTIATIPLLTS